MFKLWLNKSASVSLEKRVLVKERENVNNNVITVRYNLLSQTQTTNNIQPMRAKLARIEYYGYIVTIEIWLNESWIQRFLWSGLKQTSCHKTTTTRGHAGVDALFWSSSIILDLLKITKLYMCYIRMCLCMSGYINTHTHTHANKGEYSTGYDMK